MTTIEMYNRVLVALCVWREARGEPLLGKILVAQVIFNRFADLTDRWPNTLSGVVLQKKQFSSFNPNDPNATQIPVSSDLSFVSCCNAVDASLDISKKMVLVKESDRELLEANHYHDIGIEAPKWSKDMEYLGQVGRLKFYKG